MVLSFTNLEKERHPIQEAQSSKYDLKRPTLRQVIIKLQKGILKPAREKKYIVPYKGTTLKL